MQQSNLLRGHAVRAMDDLMHRIPAEAGNDLFNVVIDTPQGSAAKLKYDETLHAFRVSRILPRGTVFPYSFGSIPGTRAEDGDALDVLVLCDAPLCTGCVVRVRLVAILQAEQVEGGKAVRNDRLVGVPVTDVYDPPVHDVRDVDAHVLDEIEHFFTSYNAAQGRTYRWIGRGGAARARAAFDAARPRPTRDAT